MCFISDTTLQKLMVDEKKCYLFGRNQQLNDFCIDHASCSRVHSALVYHKHLDRAFLVDLGSSKYRAYTGARIQSSFNIFNESLIEIFSFFFNIL